MKFEVDTFRKTEVIKKKQYFFHKNFKFNGGNSDKICARVVNLITYDVVETYI
jgi:hypothetical protein